MTRPSRPAGPPYPGDDDPPDAPAPRFIPHDTGPQGPETRSLPPGYRPPPPPGFPPAGQEPPYPPGPTAPPQGAATGPSFTPRPPAPTPRPPAPTPRPPAPTPRPPDGEGGRASQGP